MQGEVEGIGKTRLIITAIRPNGQVDGGMVSGPVLTIDSALGGKYELALNGSQLSGTYSRGTTLRTKASFTKA